ncbi:MAG: hypothetical protein NVS1B10_06710 [Candidatus Saccharimonadales bacterium]
MSQNYFYPSSASSANPSTGSVGSAAPTTATEIAGKDAGGLMQVPLITATRAVAVDGSAVTQPVNGTVTANQGAAGPSKWLVDGSGVTQPVQPPAAVNATGSLAAAGVLFSQDCSQLQSASVHITALPAGNIVTFQVSNDNATWYNCTMMPAGDLTGILSTTANAAGVYTTQLNSRYFRANVTTYTSGTVTANAYFKTFGNSPNSVGGYVSALTLDGSGAVISSTSGALNVSAAQSGTYNITNVSGTVSLPTGAATSAKQPALGVAGTPSTDVLTVQGAAAMTALKVDGSAVTQPVSGTVALGAGAAAIGSVTVSNFPATQTTSEVAAATATLTSVASSATTVSILALNANRKGVAIFNESTSVLYLAFASTASLTAYTVQIPSNSYYELPFSKLYTGAISGIWSAANGSARITELT